MNARPMYLRRIEFRETCTEMDSEIGPAASRTFGPSPKPCAVCAGTWAVVIVTGIAVIAAIVDVVARLWQ